MRSRIIVIIGPTASGKSALAVVLAKKLNGEIISADSRQVYRGFNIGSGKITKREMKGVPHHLLDVASPKKTYTVSHFKRDAGKAIKEILQRGKIPIVVGGTGLYIDALLGKIQIPEVPPNTRLRKQLEKKSPAQLFVILKKLDPKRAKTIDAKNPRRLIRAIEIATALGQIPVNDKTPGVLSFDTLWVGLKLPPKELRKRIHVRLFVRISRGLVSEVKNLHEKEKLSWKRLERFGLEYRYVALYLQKKISKEELLTKLEIEIARYAKRQMTWFKRNKEIRWFNPTRLSLS